MAVRKQLQLALVVALLMVVAAKEPATGTPRRYMFYRSLGPAHAWGSPTGGGSRRVFGGTTVPLNTFPGACVMMDRYWTLRCSASVLASRWVLTAAHCVSPHIAYIKYNTAQPAAAGGDIATVHYLYRHPNFKVVQEDEGRGLDVTVLHHDVGLVRTRKKMLVAGQLELEPLRALRLFDPADIRDQEVKVLGFGRTADETRGEQLYQVTLRLVYCERGTWFNCVCGVASTGLPRGVCSGDSGGPVVFRGAQVAVTSMGPVECATENGALPEGATSVFTSLFSYTDLINATIHDTESAMQMRTVKRSAGAPLAPRALLGLLAPLAPLLVVR